MQRARTELDIGSYRAAGWETPRHQLLQQNSCALKGGNSGMWETCLSIFIGQQKLAILVVFKKTVCIWLTRTLGSLVSVSLNLRQTNLGLGFLCLLLGLLGQENSLDVWQHSTLGDCHTTEQLVQLLVVSDGQLQVARDDPGLLVVPCCIAGQLENLSGEIFENSCKIDWRA